MVMTMCEIREKDVVNVCDGKKLGYICDFELDTDCGRITHIYVSDRLFQVGVKGSIKLKWDSIRCIGEDTILVDAGRICSCDDRKCDRKRKYHLFEL